jgi:hypothetical protein
MTPRIMNFKLNYSFKQFSMLDTYIGHFAFDTPILAKQHQVSANHSCWLQYQKQMVANFLMLLLEIFLEKLL